MVGHKKISGSSHARQTKADKSPKLFTIKLNICKKNKWPKGNNTSRDCPKNAKYFRSSLSVSHTIPLINNLTAV
ncbi:Uncharacterised protein [Vibrio cholerae]|nr:Uncharacterised protein [Vibrio cholerae]